jgi:2'-5' RNA ligase
VTTEPRLFVAVPLDAAARSAVEAVVDSVRRIPVQGRSVRWVRLDGLHVTIRFLGPTPTSRVGDLTAAVADAAEGVEPFSMSLVGSGGFPSGGRPRAIWIGVGDGRAALETLANRVSAALVAHGWPHEERPFRAHLTLARADGAASGPATVDALGEALGGRTIPSVIDRVGVYESITGRGPAEYVARAEVPLG